MSKILSITLLLNLAVFIMANGLVEAMENEQLPKAIDLENMNRDVDPGDDFFKFVNGGWMDSNPIPEDKTRWGAFDELIELNETQLNNIFNDLKEEQYKEGTIERKISDFYVSGLDVETINDLGATPLEPYFNQVDRMQSKDQLSKMITSFSMLGTYPVFALFASPDQENSEVNIAHIYQSGLGLPDRDYYVEEGERMDGIRAEYLKLISKMFTLVGYQPRESDLIAEKIMDLETNFAEASLTRLERRDPYKTFNKMSYAEMKELAPSFNWDLYFEAIDVEADTVNVAMPDFIKNFEKTLNDYDLDTWKYYLKWRLIRSASPYLSQDFVNARFDFYGKYLSGQEKLTERWKRVLRTVNGSLGEAVGQIYVKKYFPPAAKETMDELVKNLRISLASRIEGLQWMSDETKEKALEKLNTMNVKIGYPDKWKDYSDIKISSDNYFQNVMNVGKHELREDFAKIGKKVDKDEWHMSPQTVNAYYSPTMNEIVFPAGILQPPFFNMNADDAVNYGAIGVVIGHEMTHGFDDQGRQYDKNGNLNNWWTEEDSERFTKQVDVLVEQYNNFEVMDGFFVDGKLTLGENIADFGGLTVALEALRNAKNNDLSKPVIDGFTPMQRFFLSYGQIWRQNIRDKELKKRLKEDVHSPAEARVNGGVVNVPEWYEAFGVEKDNKLFVNPDQRALIW